MKDSIGGIDNLLDHIPVPRMVRVGQNFARPRTPDVEAELLRGLDAKGSFRSLVPGSRVAVAAGSRGIANLPEVTRIIVRELKKAGAAPFIVPAMGSHGGATAEGQKALLEHLGISEGLTGAPIRSSMDVEKVGISPRFGMPVYIDKNALAADGIVVINRKVWLTINLSILTTIQRSDINKPV